MFVVYFKANKDGKKELTLSAICTSHEEAIEFCNRMKKEEKDYEIDTVPLAIGIKIESCEKVTPRNTYH